VFSSTANDLSLNHGDAKEIRPELAEGFSTAML